MKTLLIRDNSKVEWLKQFLSPKEKLEDFKYFFEQDCFCYWYIENQNPIVFLGGVNMSGFHSIWFLRFGNKFSDFDIEKFKSMLSEIFYRENCTSLLYWPQIKTKEDEDYLNKVGFKIFSNLHMVLKSTNLRSEENFRNPNIIEIEKCHLFALGKLEYDGYKNTENEKISSIIDVQTQFEGISSDFFSEEYLKGLIYISEDKPIGFVMALRKGENVEIRGLMVDRQHRSKGVGKALLHNLINILKEVTDHFELEVVDINKEAVELYKKIGFLITKEEKSAYIDKIAIQP